MPVHNNSMTLSVVESGKPKDILIRFPVSVAAGVTGGGEMMTPVNDLIMYVVSNFDGTDGKMVSFAIQFSKSEEKAKYCI